MAIQKLFTSLSKNGNIATYVGEAGRMFYDTQNGQLKLSNGVTPGGVPISISANVVVAESLLPEVDNVYSIGTESLRWHHAHLGDGGAYFNGFATAQTVPYLPSALTGSLIPAADNGVSLGSTDHRWANAYLGTRGLFLADSVTDQNINIVATNGTLYLNGAQNLQVGNLVIVDTTLTSAVTTLDISIGATNDTGYFYVKRKAQFDNTSFSSTEAMVSFNASGGADPATIFPDTVMQTVSRPNKNSRIIQRSYGSTGTVGGDNSYSVWGSYAARGNTAAPSAIKQNDILSRISSNGYGTTTWGSGGTRIESVALENFTDSAKGSKINFWTTPAGSIVSQLVASVNSIGLVANGIQFSTDSTIQTTAGIPLTQKGVSQGVATLGVDGRLTADQIPSSLTGAIVFQGGWDASTNTPTLSNGTGTTGYQYLVTVGATRNLGAGNVVYVSGDTVTYGANIWNRVSGSSPISSVSGNLHMVVGPTTGAVVVGVDATPNATNGTIVSRDASGNFQANTITAALAGQATSAITAATVTAGAQTAITSVGTLTSLAVTGNVSAGNVTSTTGTITAATGQFTNINSSLQTINANVGAFHIYANTALGSLATGANANVAAYLTTATINTTGNITAGNVIATAHYGNVVGKATRLATAGTTAIGTFLAGRLSAATGSVPKNSVATVTYTITGLTTNHNIIITPGTAMPDRAFSVAAAWASAADTVSIQYANNTGGAVSVTLDINYFAFV
jgi:hypothetical protein